jgi:hypothetical protein
MGRWPAIACWVLALAAAVPARAAALQASPGHPTCLKCRTTGKLACPEHDRDLAPAEDRVHFCSFIAACATCGGTGWIDCERCERPDVDGDLASKRARVAAGLETWAYADREMGRALRKGESAHYFLVFEIDDLKVGRTRLKDHALLHLYLDRLEELWDAYLEALQAAPKDFAQKSRVFVWDFRDDQEMASLRFCADQNAWAVKLLGSNPNYSMHRDGLSDERLHRNLVHAVTHLLSTHQAPSEWIGNTGKGWADEGLSHWMEERFFGQADTYCYEEVNSNSDFRGAKFKPAVRKLITGGDAPPIAEVFTRNTDNLKLAEHMVSFSYVDYLIALDGAKFNQLMKRLRAEVETRDALDQVYGLTPIGLETAWKAWVLSNYPAQ